jgi:uncharacterized protein (TIGR02284 family)
MEGSSSGTLHRMWLDVKATFSGHDRKSILEECERGEDAIKKHIKAPYLQIMNFRLRLPGYLPTSKRAL